MRPRNSSTLIKKSQPLILTKQPSQLNEFSTNPSIVSQTSLNPTHPQSFETTFKGKFEVRGQLNKGSINPTAGFRRTFSRPKNDHPQNDQKIHKQIQNPPKTENKPVVYSENLIKETPFKQSFYQEKPIEIKKQPIPKTRVAFYQSVTKPSNIKPKVQPQTNPQEKIVITKKASSIGNKDKMLNTRRSKFQSEVKKKEAQEKQDKQKSFITPLKKSKNINIHTIKNPSIIKVEGPKEKVETKEEIKSQVSIKEEKPVKKEEPKQQDKKVQKKQEKKQEKKPEPEQTRPDPVLNSRPSVAAQSLETSNQFQVASRVVNPIRRQAFSTENRIPQGRNERVQSPQPEPEEDISFNLNQTQSSMSSLNQSEIEELRRPDPPSQRRPQNLMQSQLGSQVGNLNLTTLVANTRDIINFIHRLNLRRRIQPFDLMIEQLTQLNNIAQQVQQLGQIGNNLGYSLVNVFGTRIRELQAILINQVGLALISSFEQNIDPEFEALVARQPALRQGFSKADIQKTFEEKLTFQEYECSICLENVQPGDSLIELQCFHGYHPICIRTWLESSRKCPMCRMEQKL